MAQIAGSYAVAEFYGSYSDQQIGKRNPHAFRLALTIGLSLQILRSPQMPVVDDEREDPLDRCLDISRTLNLDRARPERGNHQNYENETCNRALR